MTGRPGHCLAPAGKDCWLGACACPVPEPAYDPGPLPVDGAAAPRCSTRCTRSCARYVVFPSATPPSRWPLWAAHTHLVGRFESTPRLALLSPEKQCGKSRVLELLELLCAGAETLSDASPAYLYRRIGAGPVTILLDEADAIWKRGKSDETAEALRSIVNAGHRRSATVGRVEMNGQAGEARSASRCTPRPPSPASATCRTRSWTGPSSCGCGAGHRTSGCGTTGSGPPAPKVTRCATSSPSGPPTWPTGSATRGRTCRPVWPTGRPTCGSRCSWSPTSRGRLAAAGRRSVHRVRHWRAGRHRQTSGTRLLADLRDVFGDADALFTETILDRLHALDESPWADWYGKPFDARAPRQAAQALRRHVSAVRIGEDSRKGYRRADLEDAWALPAPGSETSETSETPLASTVSDVSAVSDTPAGLHRVRRAARPGARRAGDTTHPMCDPAEETTVKLSGRPRPFPRPQPAPAPLQCRICLRVTDDLHKGVCRDRAACETRQPALDLGAEVKPGGSFGHPDASDSADGS